VVQIERAAVLIGVYDSCDQAEKAVDELKRHGFRDDQLRVTLCDADLTDESPAMPLPARQRRGGLVAGTGLGGCGGGLLGVAIADSLLGLSPVLVVLGLGAGMGVLAGAALGGLFGAWIQARRQPPESHVPGRTLHLSRGIVIVRPQLRSAEATAILRHFAGCDASPAFLVGR
jgi:hypothetical protein